MTYSRLIFVGLGGGWRTPFDLAFFASYFMPDTTLHLIDGGTYDTRQLDHEHFLMPGNKARVQAEFLQREFPESIIKHTPKYVGSTPSETVEPICDVVTDGSVCFLLVDNNQTRRLICDHAATLDNVTLLCGGTNRDRLRVNVHIRRNGQDLTTPFPAYIRSVAKPTDKAPFDEDGEHCTDRLGEREEFHPFTMMATSTFLANAFYEVWRREQHGTLDEFPYQELWYDIRSGRSCIEQNTRNKE